MTRPTVVMIVGHGRSGSSIIERMLGGSDGFTNVGEAYAVFRLGVQLGLPCRCGLPFAGCGFWQGVGGEAMGSWDSDSAEWMAEYFNDHLRYRQLPMLSWRLHRGSAGVDDRRYAQTFERIYRSVADATEHDVIVDSSKHLGHAVALAHLTDLDIRVLHLVRDPRGNAYSWQKKGIGLDTMGLADRSMPVFSPARTAIDWTMRNLLTDRLVPESVPTVRLRYEDFSADPIGTIEASLTSLGITRRPTWRHVEGRSVQLPSDHAFGGNPGVVVARSATVRADDEWRTHMPRRDRNVVTALAAPLMLAYGYPLRSVTNERA